MRTIGQRNINITAVVLCCLLAAGCATTQKITDDILGKKTTLKKKMAFLPPVTGSGFGDEDVRRDVTEQLRTFLGSHCDGLRVVGSREIREALASLPRLASGQMDNLALANLGRIHGLNAVVEQRIEHIECLTDKRGIWGFRDTCMLAQASYRLRVYDVETTAVLLDETVMGEVEVSQHAWNTAKNTGQLDVETARRLLVKMTPEVGKMLCERLGDEPWKGYIISGSDNKFTISAGADAGLAAGDVLEVFGMGEPMKGRGDQVFLVSGLKIGEIQVASVQRDQAEAIGISGHDLEKSSCVKLKQ